MARQERPYKRLPGMGTAVGGMFGRSTLWVAGDHLLAVRNYGYSEQYKRLHFANIQALAFHKTRTGTVITAVWGILDAILLSLIGIGTWQGWDSAGIWTLVVFAVFCAVFLVAGLIAGPTCKTYARTAVQLEELPSLGRVRNTMRVIARLRPLIEAAQAPLAQEHLERYDAELALSSASPAEAASPVFRHPRPIQLRHCTGRVHAALFWLFVLDAVIGCVAILSPNLAIFVLGILVPLTQLGLAVAALVQQDRSDATRALKIWTWIALGDMLAFATVGYIRFIAEITAGAGSGRPANPWDWIVRPPAESPFHLAVISTAVLASTIVAMGGLRAHRMFREKLNSPPPPPPPPPSPPRPPVEPAPLG